MKQGNVSLETIDVQALPGFARRVQEERERFAVVPITPLRAEAQARNPAASPGDVGLLVAYCEDRCIGYLGLLPALLEDRGARRRVYALSALYVAPEHRKTGAGSLLVLRAASLGTDLLVAGASDAAAALFRAMRFTPAGPLPYFNLRLEALLPLSFAFGASSRRLERGPLAFLAPILGAARMVAQRSLDAILRPLLVRALRSPFHARCGGVVARATPGVEGPGATASTTAERGKARIVRDAATINWMIRYPWITEEPGPRLAYVFSHRRDLFRFLPFEIRRAGAGLGPGFLVLSVSSERGRTVLKVLDHSFPEGIDRACALDLVLQQAARWEADVIECPGDWGALLAASRLTRMITERAERRYFVFTRDARGLFAARLHEFAPGHCDGDAPFV